MIWGYANEMLCPFLDRACEGNKCSKFNQLIMPMKGKREYGQCKLYVKVYIEVPRRNDGTNIHTGSRECQEESNERDSGYTT